MRTKKTKEKEKSAILQQAQEYFERSCQQNYHYMYMDIDGFIFWIEELSNNITHKRKAILLDIVGCGNYPYNLDDYVDVDGDFIDWYDIEPDAEKLLVKPLRRWEWYRE